MVHDTVTKIIPIGPARRYPHQTFISGNRGGSAFIPPTRFGADPSDAAMLMWAARPTAIGFAAGSR
jgi:hypothetical protein